MKGSEPPLINVTRNHTTHANIVYKVLVQTDKEVPSVYADGGLLETQGIGARESHKNRGRENNNDNGGREIRLSWVP